MKHICYISIGSNIGNRLNFLQTALKCLKDDKSVIDKISSVYESQTWGFDGRDFLNVCVKIITSYKPEELILKLLEIEKKIGRENFKEKLYSSRTIDLDILFYADLIIQKNNLIIPHPRIELRNFVLFPLQEISKNLVHPILKKSIEELIELKKDKTIIKKTKLNIVDSKIFDKYKYISVEGNIGVGKTTLTKIICDKYEVKGLFENYINNPYLKKFYQNPEKFSFDVETYFLKERIKSLENFWKINNKGIIISDYSIYKSLIFSKENLKGLSLKKYVVEYEKGLTSLEKPNLIIYLDAPSKLLLERIQQRGRDFEKNISEIYLKKIEEGYKKFLIKKHSFKVIFYDVSDKDFINNEYDLENLLKIIYNF